MRPLFAIPIILVAAGVIAVTIGRAFREAIRADAREAAARELELQRRIGPTLFDEPSPPPPPPRERVAAVRLRDIIRLCPPGVFDRYRGI